MYNGMQTYRALVTYSSPTTGEVLVKIPSILGEENTLSISFLNRSAGSNGLWEVPEIGSQVLVAVEDERFSNVFLLTWADPDRTVAPGGNAGDLLVKTSSTDYDTSWTDAPTVDALNFDQVNPDAVTTARLVWNDTEGTLDLGLKGGLVTASLSSSTLHRVVNRTGTNLTRGQVVRLYGSQGQRVGIALAQATNDPLSSKTFGVLVENIDDNQSGFVMVEGMIRNINTQALAEGEIIWLSPTTPGGMTTTKPTAPDHLVMVGVCVTQANNGIIFVKVQNGYEVDELHDVKYTNLATGDLLTRTSNNLWENITRANLNTTLDHGALTGLGDDDHTQYHNNTRGDARYLQLTGGTVTGVTAYQSNLNVGGNASVSGTFIASGAASAGSTLYVGGVTTLNSTLTHGGVTHVPHSTSVTASRPTSPVTGQTWWDSSKKRLWVYSGSAWVPVAWDMPRFRYTHGTVSNVVNNTVTTVPWSTQVYDTDAFSSASSGTFTLPSNDLAGLYLINMTWVNPSISSTSYELLFVYKNTDTNDRYASISQGGAYTKTLNSSGLITLSSTSDYFKAAVFQNSGSNQTLGNATVLGTITGILIQPL